MAVRFQLRRDTAANWASANSVLALGEPGVETDTLKVKVGDGSTAWNSLAYSITKDFADLTNTPTTLAAYGITDALSLAQLSVTQNSASGTGALSYNNATGVFEYTPPDFAGLTGDFTGSVFADDSTLLVDGVNATLNLANNSTTDLSEGTNLYYTDVRADARIAAAGITDLSDADQTVQTTDDVTFNSVTGNVITSLIDSADSSAIEIQTDVEMLAGLTVGNHIVPSSSENIDLGSVNARFRDLYLSGNSAIIGDLALKRHISGGLIVSDHSTGNPTNVTTHNITANDITAAGDVDVTGNLTMTGYIAGPATMTIDPAAVGDNTGTLVVAGNLQVDGTTTTINSQTLEVEDKNVVLGPNAANDAANNGAGITVTQPDTSDATLIYDTTSTQWEFNKDLDVAGIVTATEINLDATGDIHSTVDTGYVGIAGGTNSNVGANALFYGGTHATLAGVTKFRSGSTGTVTILANGNVGIGYDSPADNIHILGSNASPNVGITLQSDDTANATAALSLFARNASNINITSEIKNVAGQLFIERSDAGTDVLALKSTAAGAGGPQLDFYHHSASPAAGDTVGRINFNGYDDGSNATTYARIDGVANDVTNGAEKGHLVFSNRVNGSSFSEALRIDDEGGVFTGGQITGRGGGATSHLFHIDGTGKYYFELQQSDTSGNTDILFSDGTGGDYGVVGYEHANDRMQFYTKSNRRMVIDENGTIGIGTTDLDSWSTVFDGRVRLGATGFVGSTSASTQLGNNWLYDGTAYKRIAEDYALRYYQNGGDHVWETAVSAAADSTITWATKMFLGSNGNLEIGYAGAARQQADSQALSIITPASGGGQGIALKRLDSNSDQQLGEISFSNNTQDGLGGMRMKTSGAVNTTELNFDIASGGAISTPLKLDNGGVTVTGNHTQNGARVQMQTFDLFSSSTSERRVRVTLGNYESCYVRIMCQRTNGGDAIAYWEGLLNNNNNANYVTELHSKSSNPTFTFDYTTTTIFQWTFNASVSPGDGVIYVQDIRGGASISLIAT